MHHVASAILFRAHTADWTFLGRPSNQRQGQALRLEVVPVISVRLSFLIVVDVVVVAVVGTIVIKPPWGQNHARWENRATHRTRNSAPLSPADFRPFQQAHGTQLLLA
jgi:hypothetical protein